MIKSKNDHLMQVSSHPVFGGCILKKFGSLNYNLLTEVVLLLSTKLAVVFLLLLVSFFKKNQREINIIN